jgi:tyrosine-specific transport protein
VALAADGVQPEGLAHADWAALPDALGIMMLSFVYQNMVPIVVENLEGDTGKIRAAICLGVGGPRYACPRYAPPNVL